MTCALCCTYVAVDTDSPNTVKNAAQILWFLYHENVSIYVEDDDWIVQLESRCRHLQDDNRCGIYEQRPHMCREYDERDCEVNARVVGETFTTPSEYLEALRKRHPRVYSLLAKRYMPDAAIIDGRKPRGAMKPFIQRFETLRSAVHGPPAAERKGKTAGAGRRRTSAK
jgi:Fe-S-cluster containining protein